MEKIAKAGSDKSERGVIKSILITQPKPESEKSPWYELERKHGVILEFCPFIKLEGLQPKEFRRQKIDVSLFSAVVFTSKNAIDHFFRLSTEMKISINQDTKYFCITEAVALYLQKFILYRKRKVFFGADGTNKGLFDVIQKHKANESFLYPCSENQQDNEITNWLKEHNCEFATPFMYRTISADVKDIIKHNFDVICFFTPSGVKSLFDNVPDFKQDAMLIGAFGSNTSKAVEESGLSLDIKAPSPKSPSMLAALDKFLQEAKAK